MNSKTQAAIVENGYAKINRKWKKGDRVELSLPMKPRVITANPQVKDLKNMVALASGPVIYCFEAADNEKLDAMQLDADAILAPDFRAEFLKGVNVITGTSKKNGREVRFTAIPYYGAGNRQLKGYKVLLPKTTKI